MNVKEKSSGAQVRRAGSTASFADSLLTLALVVAVVVAVVDGAFGLGVRAL